MVRSHTRTDESPSEHEKSCSPRPATSLNRTALTTPAMEPLPPAPQGKRVGKRDVCEDTAYLKMSNHIFGGRSREEGALTMDQMKEMRKGKF